MFTDLANEWNRASTSEKVGLVVIAGLSCLALGFVGSNNRKQNSWEQEHLDSVELGIKLHRVPTVKEFNEYRNLK